MDNNNTILKSTVFHQTEHENKSSEYAESVNKMCACALTSAKSDAGNATIKHIYYTSRICAATGLARVRARIHTLYTNTDQYCSTDSRHSPAFRICSIPYSLSQDKQQIRLPEARDTRHNYQYRPTGMKRLGFTSPYLCCYVAV